MSLIVFDLDGTLIDSKRDLAESTNEMLVSYGAVDLAIDDVAKMVGEGARMLVRRALEASQLGVDETEALARFREIYDRRLLIHTRPYDGIPDVVAGAATRGRLAVLTNKPEAPARRLLDAFDLSRHLRWVLGGDSGFPRKPDPTALRHLMAEAEVPPERTLFVGDSIIDVNTARAADVPICLARYGFGHARGENGLDAADFSADSPRDLVRIIDRFLRA
jgi:phosphoglycolate phosphatase